MKAYLHPFKTRHYAPAALPPRKEHLVSIDQRLVGLKAGMDVLLVRTMSVLYRELNHVSSVLHPLA